MGYRRSFLTSKNNLQKRLSPTEVETRLTMVMAMVVVVVAVAVVREIATVAVIVAEMVAVVMGGSSVRLCDGL